MSDFVTKVSGDYGCYKHQGNCGLWMGVRQLERRLCPSPSPCKRQRNMHEPTRPRHTLARSRPYKDRSRSRSSTDELNPRRTPVDARGQERTENERRRRLSAAVSLETAGLSQLAQRSRTNPCLAKCDNRAPAGRTNACSHHQPGRSGTGQPHLAVRANRTDDSDLRGANYLLPGPQGRPYRWFSRPW
jgi:hypothetical protein